VSYNTQTRLKELIFGHDWAIDLLTQAIASGNTPQSLLITGVSQLGKSTLARVLAQTLNCTDDVKPCGQCSSCRKMESGNHPDITILDKTGDKTDSLKIETIRELQHDLTLRPHESPHKIAVLCNFERATTGAANALLKTLEEPPGHVTLILTAQTVDTLLPTIVSRCQIINLRPTSTEAVMTMLQTRYQASTEQAQHLGQLSGGRPGWAVKALTDPGILSRREQLLTDLLDLIQRGYAFRLGYAQNVSQKGRSSADLLNLWLLWWRDVLLIKHNTNQSLVNSDQTKQLQWLANALSQAQIVSLIKQTRNSLKNLNTNVNERLNLEVLLLNLPHLKP
jgi:DNA polymerase-3 subunit delta'